MIYFLIGHSMFATISMIVGGITLFGGIAAIVYAIYSHSINDEPTFTERANK